MEKSRFYQFHICHCNSVFTSVFTTRRPCYVSKRLIITAVFGSSEPLHFLGLNGRVSAIHRESTDSLIIL